MRYMQSTIVYTIVYTWCASLEVEADETGERLGRVPAALRELPQHGSPGTGLGYRGLSSKVPEMSQRRTHPSCGTRDPCFKRRYGESERLPRALSPP